MWHLLLTNSGQGPVFCGFCAIVCVYVAAVSEETTAAVVLTAFFYLKCQPIPLRFLNISVIFVAGCLFSHPANSSKVLKAVKKLWLLK